MSDYIKDKIGIIGGSGIYDLFDNPEEREVKTKYGKPSSKLAFGEIAGKSVVFLTRHGKKHSIPPHLVNYRANIMALHEAGVSQIISAGAVGSLRKVMAPGDIVITDQFIDRTKGREDTYIEGPQVEHLAAANLYCNDLRKIAIKSAKGLGVTCHEQGTVVVINGPRFSSQAESLWYKKMGWDILSMTQYPENVLAAELGMCYCNIGMVTDYDAGLEFESDIEPVTWDQVKKVMTGNAKKFETLVTDIIKNLPIQKTPCEACKK